MASLASLIASAQDGIEYIWKLVGYSLFFFIPLLLVSPTLRTSLLSRCLRLSTPPSPSTEQKSPPQPPKSTIKTSHHMNPKTVAAVATHIISNDGDATTKGINPRKPLDKNSSLAETLGNYSDDDISDGGVLDDGDDYDADDGDDMDINTSDLEWLTSEFGRLTDSGEVMDDKFLEAYTMALNVLKLKQEVLDLEPTGVVNEVVEKEVVEKEKEEEEDKSTALPPPSPPPMKSIKVTPTSTTNSMSSTSWVKDLPSESDHTNLLTTLKNGNGAKRNYSNVGSEDVKACLDTFNDSISTAEELKNALVQLALMVETFSDSSQLSRRAKHSNQMTCISVILEFDGLASIHNVQGTFGEQEMRALASSVLAKIASKIYEGWN